MATTTKKTTTRKTTTKTAKAPSLKAPKPTLQFTVELKDEEGKGVWVGRALRLYLDNDSDPDLKKVLLALKRGQSVKYGGGAAPLWRIRRM